MTDGLTPVRFDLSSVDVHRNQAVFEHLAERGAYFELDGDVLVVPARYAAAVADLLFPIERPAIRRIGRPLPPRDDGLPRLAPIATRPFGWLVDLAALVVAMVMLVSLLSAGGSGDGLRPGVPIVAALLVLVAPIVRRGTAPVVRWSASGS